MLVQRIILKKTVNSNINSFLASRPFVYLANPTIRRISMYEYLYSVPSITFPSESCLQAFILSLVVEYISKQNCFVLSSTSLTFTFSSGIIPRGSLSFLIKTKTTQNSTFQIKTVTSAKLALQL